MNIEQINELISNYEKLMELVETKVETLSKLDSYFDPGFGVESVYFQDDKVVVVYDESWGGCSSVNTFYFPIFWLAKSDEELVQLVAEAKVLRKEEARKAIEALEDKRRKEKEQNERADYERLKKKFGDKE